MQAASRKHDCRFVEPIPDSLICLICTFVARNPQQTICCGKVFCKDCLVELKRHSSKCPQCRRKVNSFSDKRSDRDIKSLKIFCVNDTNGCEWVGQLGSLEEHLTSCDFTLLPCPNECKSPDKNIVQVLCKEIEKHKKEECPRRQYKCPHCKEAGEYQERTTTHLEECPQLEIPCPNNGCGENMPRYQISKHGSMTCKFQQVKCKYAPLGCTTELYRQEIPKHEDDLELHFSFAMGTILYLQLQNTTANKTISQLEERLAACENPTEKEVVMKFTNFERHKTFKYSVFSPPFYTSPGGYKLCISVDANGFNQGRYSHISVFAFLMRGENDDHLPWPFTGKVTIELLNQLKDDNHHCYIASFPPNDKVSQRVQGSERASTGFGDARYLPHSSLGYDAINSCQYLKNDCLYFRLKAEAADPKPWLSITGSF